MHPVCDVGVLWPNGWMDQDETWHGGRSRHRPHCVRRHSGVLDGDPVTPKGTQPPIFSSCLLWPNDWMKMPVHSPPCPNLHSE